MIRKVFIAALAVLTLACSCKHKDGEYKLDIYAVSDVHGRYFSQSYTGGADQQSLSNVSAYLKEARKADPNLIFIDNGDNLQGDNAAYYYNYVATDEPHIYRNWIRIKLQHHQFLGVALVWRTHLRHGFFADAVTNDVQ